MALAEATCGANNWHTSKHHRPPTAQYTCWCTAGTPSRSHSCKEISPSGLQTLLGDCKGLTLSYNLPLGQCGLKLVDYLCLGVQQPQTLILQRPTANKPIVINRVPMRVTGSRRELSVSTHMDECCARTGCGFTTRNCWESVVVHQSEGNEVSPNHCLGVQQPQTLILHMPCRVTAQGKQGDSPTIMPVCRLCMWKILMFLHMTHPLSPCTGECCVLAVCGLPRRGWKVGIEVGRQH
jgi:hypothetical protein